jgi:hypothetical protein
MRDLYRECAKTIRATMTDSEHGHPRHKTVGAFGPQTADIFRADDPAFSFGWFFGACVLDNWVDLMVDRADRS